MWLANNTLRDTLNAAMGAVAEKVVEQGGDRWRLTFGNGTTAKTRLTDDGWLLMRAHLRGRRGGRWSAEQAWNLLCKNVTLRGLAKFTLNRDGSPMLACEIPVEEGVDMAQRIREAGRGFEEAIEQLQGKTSAMADTEPDTSGPTDGVEDRNGGLARLCHDAGWPFIERPSGRLAVALESPQAYAQAILTPQASGGVHVSVDLAASETPSGPCRQAVSVMLLAAGAVVRMARPVGLTKGDQSVTAVEVAFPSSPPVCAAEIGDALSALSVACRVCAREAAVLLQNEIIARRFLLEVRGWSSGPDRA